MGDSAITDWRSMNDFALVEKNQTALGGVIQVEQQRAIQETQAAMIVAKRFPRDQNEAYTRIIKSCRRQTLAQNATYAYPKGGQMVTGPSIRLAEAIAQNWGNLQFGIRELSQDKGGSEVEAFAWDIETNTRQVKIFKVPHVRFTKKNGNKKLDDPREIYELVANQGARRLRACILGIIPGDIVEAAVNKCEETLRSGSETPIVDRIREMLIKFSDQGVTKEMIETRICHNSDTIIEQELISLGKIFNSLRDGMTRREEWFNSQDITKSADDINSKLSAVETTKKQEDTTTELDNAIIEDFNELWVNAKSECKLYAGEESGCEKTVNGYAKPTQEQMAKWVELSNEWIKNNAKA